MLICTCTQGTYAFRTMLHKLFCSLFSCSKIVWILLYISKYVLTLLFVKVQNFHLVHSYKKFFTCSFIGQFDCLCFHYSNNPAAHILASLHMSLLVSKVRVFHIFQQSCRKDILRLPPIVRESTHFLTSRIVLLIFGTIWLGKKPNIL